MNLPTGPAAANWPAGPQPFLPPPAPEPARKPATLAITFWLSVVVAVLSIAGALITIFTGKDAIRTYVAKTVSDTLGTDVDPGVINATVGDELNSDYHKLVVKAVIGIVVAVLVLVFALVARNGSTGGRVGLAIALAVGLCGGTGIQLVDADLLPSATVALEGVTPLLSLIAIVCAFVPATNRYAKARKAVR